MTFKSKALVFLFAVFALAFAPRAYAADDAQADALFRKGREAAARKDWTGARAAYAQAWSIKQSYDIAANLGQAEYKLGLYRDAAEHLDYALRHFPAATEAEDVRTRITQARDDAKQQVVTVRLSVDKPHASIAVDGKPVGQSPLSSELYVEPGTHTVEATLAGYRPAMADVAASAGEEMSVQLTLQPESPAPTAAPAIPPAQPAAPAPPPPSTTFSTSPPPTHDSAGKRSVWPLVIGAGVTGAALAGGILLRVRSSQKADEADDLAADIAVTAQRCDDTPRPTKCADLRDARKAKDDYQNWSTVAFVGAGVAAVGTVVTYLLWPTSDAPRVGFGVTPKTAAFTLEHTF